MNIVDEKKISYFVSKLNVHNIIIIKYGVADFAAVAVCEKLFYRSPSIS